VENTQITFPPNLCLAPFVYLTFDPAKNVSPCPALGGGVWNFKGQPIHKIWTNDELVKFRQDMLENKRHEVCARCWEEEAIGLPSQRTRLWDMNLDPNGTTTHLLETEFTPQDVLKPNYYLKGPMQLAVKVSNVCNLRCRSCNSADSITLSVEGQYYAEKFNLPNNFYLLETETKTLSDQHIDEIVSMCHNVHRLEFYGGEPLLDKQLPHLLNKLIAVGLHQQITINISTNVTQALSDDLFDTLIQFKAVNINLSIDGWGEKFTYLRHPAQWSLVYNNIKKFIKCAVRSRGRIKLLPVTTVTIMNVHDLPELVENLKQNFRMEPFFIIARNPSYFSIKHIPTAVAESIIGKLQSHAGHDYTAIINAMRQIPDPAHWAEFKQWTSMIDSYRNESFVQTFPEYTKLIANHDTNFLTEVANFV
jgi:MoaA/NifB/PqqE/SkfB family radical SAM enzyme